MTRTIPEPVRAWAWHTARAVLILTALAAVVAVGSVLLYATAYAISGHGSWLPPLLLLGGAVLVVGTVTWLRAGRTRP